jgi:beta-glucosidase-like glycosyl hydrolase
MPSWWLSTFCFGHSSFPCYHPHRFHPFPSRAAIELTFAAALLPSIVLHTQDTPAAQAADPEVRARQIVSQMTLDEKVAQMHGTRTREVYRIVVGVPRLGIPDLLVTNGPAGFGPAGPGHQGKATALPAPISVAATWDVDAAREYGMIEASESADFGNTLLETPDINIARVPQPPPVSFSSKLKCLRSTAMFWGAEQI